MTARMRAQHFIDIQKNFPVATTRGDAEGRGTRGRRRALALLQHTPGRCRGLRSQLSTTCVAGGSSNTWSMPGICSDYRFPQMGFNTVWPSAIASSVQSILDQVVMGHPFFFLVHLDLTQRNARHLTVSKNNLLFIN